MSERRALDAVLLDAGGTLVRLDFEWMAETVGDLGAETTAARLREGELLGRRRYDASRGVHDHAGAVPAPAAPGDIDAYFAGILEGAGVPAPLWRPAVERFIARHQDSGLWSRPMEGARAALDGLGALGLRLAVVSNSDGRAEAHLRDCGVLDGIEFVVDSHLVGIEKPAPGIFAIALERLAIPAGRALFVGDIRCLDEVGARAAGVPFVLIDPSGDYAVPGTAAIADMARLPQWVASRFDTPRGTGPVRPAGGGQRTGGEQQ